MWVCLSNAFLSIHRPDDCPDGWLCVRARRSGDLEQVFNLAKGSVTRTPNVDYLYRVRLRRDVVQRVIAAEVGKVCAPNFKQSVADPDLHAAYLSFWSTMWNLQRRQATSPSSKTTTEKTERCSKLRTENYARIAQLSQATFEGAEA
jgi:hypothetical protein